MGLGFAAIAGASWAAGIARADVLDVGPDGAVTHNTGPAVYLTDDLQPRPISPRADPARAFGRRDGYGQLRAPRSDVANAIRSESTRYGVSPLLVEAVAWRESGFNSIAVSPKGALGVMQLMPGTAQALGVDPNNVADNIHGGVAYLSWLLKRYDGDVVKSLAAYNAGPAAVSRFGGLPPYRETRAYIDAVFDRMNRANPTAPAVPKPQETPVKPATVLPVVVPVSLVAATPAFAQVVRDPAGSEPILAALQWIQGTLLGSLATTAAVIAVAVVGLMMLTGRIEWRRGLTVVLGAFIIFGAVAIVAGMRSIAGGAG